MTQILIISDIHEDWNQLNQHLNNKEAELIIVAGDWSQSALGTKKGLELMQEANKPVWVIPGNMESYRALELADQMKVKLLHEQVLEFKDLKIGGIGYSTPSPFNTPGEEPEEYFEDLLQQEKFTDAPLDIFVTHDPPHGTQLDKLSKGHVGSKAIKRYIEQYQPNYSFHGHIHECAGVSDKIRETKAHSVGKQGYLLSIE